MAKNAVNSHFSFARNFILAEKSRFRSSPLLVAANRCRYWAITKLRPQKNRKSESQKTYAFNGEAIDTPAVVDPLWEGF